MDVWYFVMWSWVRLLLACYFGMLLVDVKYIINIRRNKSGGYVDGLK